MSPGRAVWPILVVVLVVAPSSAEIPYKTRQDIINYAATGIGSPYIWGGGNWDPSNRGFGGADCSGFVCKAWSLTRWTPYRVDYHGPYSTASLIQTPGPYWDEVDRSDLLYGDAIVYRYNNNQNGHTYVFLSGDGWGEHEVYEARGSAYGIVHRWRTAYSGADVTKGIRRTRLIENIGVTEHIVETDHGAPYYTDSGMTGGSPYDSYALGCREGDCRYRWVTANRNETCTFQPDLPETGRYRIYVTCNEDSPNVQGVGVTVNHALGSDSFVWDQGSPADLNTWVPVGNQGFLFNTGSAGTVVWDDFNATPTDGSHVFRGDATRFTLDNRVEVNGVGGEPGKFATIGDALAWLRTHESEEPDVINISCDMVVETGCIEFNLLDDLTVNGDADSNGIPVTIAVTPGVPSDWSRSCAMYLDIPIQHHYTLRDIVLAPQYVSAGYATGAYGIAIDEQNPGGDACAMSLTLENVTVAGSLPGNVPTDPETDSRALATMFGGTDGDYGAGVLQRTSDWAGDDACRQVITATNLTITHGATRGLALRSAYTDWDIDGGLRITYNGLEGIRADHLGGSTLTIHDSSGGNPNRIAGNLGGGLVNVGDAGVGSVSLSNCTVTDNAGDQGGGITSEYATTIVKNTMIAGNVSTGEGGAALATGGSMSLANCTIVNNTAAGGVGGVFSSSASLAVSNSILWGNSAGQCGGNANVSYCDVQGGYAGTGNIDDDPVFADPASSDYHLRRGSPCINAGDPAFVPATGETDIDGEPRVQGGLVDIGANETPFWNGDADQDGDVDLDDLAVFVDCLAGPGAAPSPTPPVSAGDCLDAFDLDVDTDVDFRDYAAFQRMFTGAVFTDCNTNGLPDDQDIADATSRDCNSNGVPDECDIADGASFDCQSNGVPDECDIALGTSVDSEGDGVPDECSLPLVFADDFDTDTSTDWIVNTTADAAATFAYDYGADGIPPSPNSGGTTLGLKFVANVTLGAAPQIAVATPANLTMSGTYQVRFDFWVNANGPFPAGGTGSTEFLGGGVGYDGVTPERNGALLIIDGEGGSTWDWRLYKDTELQDVASGQYDVDSNNNSGTDLSSFFPPQAPPQLQQNTYPQQTGQTNPGCGGFAWHTMVITVDSDAGTAHFAVDGLSIGTLDTSIGSPMATSGHVQVMYADTYDSISDNPDLSFGIIDNFSVLGFEHTLRTPLRTDSSSSRLRKPAPSRRRQHSRVSR